MRTAFVVLFLFQTSLLQALTARQSVFTCDFDEVQADLNKICNGNLTLRATGQQSGVFESLLLYSKNTHLTDLTSIESAAQNGELCKIPFLNSVNSEESYFCIEDADKFTCETMSGQTSQCNLGKFFGVRTIQPGNNFNINWELDPSAPIKLPKKGNYFVEFGLFYNCDASECDAVQDKLTFTIFTRQASDNLNQVEVYEFAGVNQNIKWEKMRIYFGTSIEQIYLRVRFERVKGKRQGEAVFALDNVEVFENDQPTTTKESTTTTTTTTTTTPTTRTTTTTTKTTTSTTTTTTTTTNLPITEAQTTTKKSSDLSAILPAILVPLGIIAFSLIICLIYFKKTNQYCFSRPTHPTDDIKMKSNPDVVEF